MVTIKTGNMSVGVVLLIVLLLLAMPPRSVMADTPPTDVPPVTVQADNPNPPANPVKLIFLHPSTGGNWLADPNGDQPYGGLGLALRNNNYYVSATNYGWGPDGIGDRTDIPNWPEWFTGVNRNTILAALYAETDQNFGGFGDWTRLATDPGGDNDIVMFKSCFPNSALSGSPTDPPAAGPNDWDYSVSNAKAVYNNLLTYFATRPDKLFVVITAPPLMAADTNVTEAANARAFNNWLVNDWLTGYTYANVAVFDYYNVLTAADNHHRWNGSAIEHLQPTASNVSAYPSGDSHPSTAGQQKATTEFGPLLNVFYHRWQAGLNPAPALTLVAPNGGEHWPVDSSHQIRWTTTGTVTQVNLYYALANVTATITTNVANTGLYTWTTPATATDLARVRVESVVSPTTVYAVSRTDFTLCEPGNCDYLLYLPVIVKNNP